MAIPVDFELSAPNRKTTYDCRAVKLSDNQPWQSSSIDIDYECVDRLSKITIKRNIRLNLSNFQTVKILETLKESLL